VVDELLSACRFPPAGTAVDLAVSGGPDSLGLALLALEAQLVVTVHHVDHHARAHSGNDAEVVAAFCRERSVRFCRHDVDVAPGPNFEARARSARRAVMPAGVLTGHTMDDLAETVLVNTLRGAGVDGLSPFIDDATKPLRDVRRAALHDFVRASGVAACVDETNEDPSFVRNRVRHELVPLMNDLSGRDVVPLLARQARVLFEDRTWLNALLAPDLERSLDEVDCRELAAWPRAKRVRWLRTKLAYLDDLGDTHPPTAAEIERALAVVAGNVVAAELSGGRRLARRHQRLFFEVDSTTLKSHG